MLQISELLQLVIGAQSDEMELSSVVKNAQGRFRSDLPPVVVWNVNNRCNMTCPHCYASAKLNPTYDGVTTSEAHSIIEQLAAYGIRIVIFSGGEPLMRADLFELIAHAREKKMSCHVSSNGTFITEEVALQLATLGVTYVGVSIDGLEPFNDKYRGLEQGFSLAWRGVRNAQAAGLDTGIRITVTSQNEDQVLPLINLATANNVPRFYLSHLVYGGRGKAYARYDIDLVRNRALMEQLFVHAVKLLRAGDKPSIVTGGNDADCALLYLFVEREFGAKPAQRIYDLLESRGGNSAGEKIINIDHKANVHPDQFWQTSKCGNLLKQPLREILQCELIQQLRERASRLEGKCGACCYQTLCRGSHRERALAAYGNLWAEDPACYFSELEVRQVRGVKSGVVEEIQYHVE